MTAIHSNDMDSVNMRLGHIESTILEHGMTLATLLGKQESIDESLKSIVATLREESKSSVSGSLTQKVLIGAIIVQSVLSGLLGPDSAKNLLHGLLGGTQ